MSPLSDRINRTASVAEFYSRLASSYDDAYSGGIERAEDAALRRLLRQRGVNAPCTRVLDLGCGTGLLLRLCPERVRNPYGYLGVDIAQGMIDRAQRHFPRNDLRCVDIAAVPSLLTKPSFEHAVSLWGSVNYVAPETVRRTLDASLVYGGQFFIMTLRRGISPSVHTPELDAALYDYSDFGRMMEPHGYEVRARPFSRQWRLPWPLGIAVELLGSRLPVGFGRHRYIIWEGVRR